MKISTYTLELLTPCLCAGAHQAKAEIRAPSIRGQLRWWFRALGGNVDDERHVFGGVAGTAKASSLTVRICDVRPGPPWNPPRIDPNSPDSYVWYFASVSGKAPGSGRNSPGPRWTPAGAMAPGTTFRLQILQRKVLVPAALQDQLDLAIRCFLQLGSFGLRATRGLGTFACHEVPFSPTCLGEIKARGFSHEFRPLPALGSVEAIANEIGLLLKGTRKALDMPHTTQSPFGSSSPRQTSAIFFRPVRANLPGTDCSLVVFEAPHARVLGVPSRRNEPAVGRSPSRLVRFVPPARR